MRSKHHVLAQQRQLVLFLPGGQVVNRGLDVERRLCGLPSRKLQHLGQGVRPRSRWVVRGKRGPSDLRPVRRGYVLDGRRIGMPHVPRGVKIERRSERAGKHIVHPLLWQLVGLGRQQFVHELSGRQF
jgi:hypothetical protein